MRPFGADLGSVFIYDPTRPKVQQGGSRGITMPDKDEGGAGHPGSKH